MTKSKLTIPIGTQVPNIGVVEAIKSSNGNKDYLLKDDRGVVTWLDELALTAILEASEDHRKPVYLYCPYCPGTRISTDPNPIQHKEGCKDYGFS